LFSGPHTPQQVQHGRLIQRAPLPYFTKVLKVRLDLIGGNSRPPGGSGAFGLFDGFDVGGIQRGEVGHGSPLFIAHLDQFPGPQSDLRLFSG
jgi:hypothetical protein